MSMLITRDKVDGPALFGCDWLLLVKLNWHEIKAVCSAYPRPPAIKVEQSSGRIQKVHSGDIGKLSGAKAKLYVEEGTTPKYRPAPRLQDLGIITPVESSDWAIPMVPVMDGGGMEK